MPPDNVTGFARADVRGPRVAHLKLSSVHLQRPCGGCCRADGPAWVGAGRCWLWSDSRHGPLLRCGDTDGAVLVFHQPSPKANSRSRDRRLFIGATTSRRAVYRRIRGAAWLAVAGGRA